MSFTDLRETPLTKGRPVVQLPGGLFFWDPSCRDLITSRKPAKYFPPFNGANLATPSAREIHIGLYCHPFDLVV